MRVDRNSALHRIGGVSPWYISAAVLLATLLTLHGFGTALPPYLWWQALWVPDQGDIRQLLFHHALLPRTVVSLLAGAALGLAGVIMQQTLRNPLVEPATLGTAAGAGLALTLVSLYAPQLMLAGREWAAFGGAVATTALAILLSIRTRLSPLSLLLAGMVVSLTCGAIGGVLVLFNHEYLTAIFLWQAGSLLQNGWHDAANLALGLSAAGLIIALLIRPLASLDLEDSGAKSLGVNPSHIRLAALVVAVGLTGIVVAAVGIIAFVGLAAPAFARLAGARRFRDRLLLSPVIGAVMLWLADQTVRELSGIVGGEIPAGIVTALLGGPLFLFLLRRYRETPVPAGNQPVARRSGHPVLVLAGVAVGLGIVTAFAVMVGRDAVGWHWSGYSEIGPLLQWRVPRVMAAASAGAMLSVAGVLLQRMTGNVLASPEILGISSGAVFGFIIALLVVSEINFATLFGPAVAGAALTTIALLLLGRRSDYAPERLLLTGVALTTVVAAFAQLVMLSGHPNLDLVVRMMAGSTYFVTGHQAVAIGVIAISALVLVPLAGRLLVLLPLGAPAAAALGVPVARSRLVLLMVTALLTAAATLIVGPLSFVGLMAPHMARMLGLVRPITLLLGSALIGAAVMVVADWLGRTVAFAWQIPAGLLASLVGGPYFMVLMIRRPAS